MADNPLRIDRVDVSDFGTRVDVMLPSEVFDALDASIPGKGEEWTPLRITGHGVMVHFWPADYQERFQRGFTPVG